MKFLIPSHIILRKTLFLLSQCPCSKDQILANFKWDDRTTTMPVFAKGSHRMLRDWEFGIIECFANSSQFDRLRNWDGSAIFAIALDGTSFHGQQNRAWHTGPGNIYLSMAIPVVLPVSKAENLQMLPAHILVSLVEPYLKKGFRCEIKRPNDIIIEDGAVVSKLAGILTEMRVCNNRIIQIRYGIGLNVMTAPDIQDSLPAISMLQVVQTPKICQLPKLIIRILHDIMAELVIRD